MTELELARAIERWKGANAPAYVAERIEALTLAGDEAGVTRFKKIAARLEQVASQAARPVA